MYSSIHCENCKFYEVDTSDVILDYKGFEDSIISIDSSGDGKQYTFIFDNGYGASVINNKYSYGGKDGLFELAVLEKAEDEQYELTYSTPIAGDVRGYLTSEDVRNYLKQIRELKGDEVDD